MRKIVFTALVAAVALAAGGAQAAVRVFVGGAVTPPLREVAAAFERGGGGPVEIVSDTTGGLQKRLQAGEKADVLVVAGPGMDALQKAGLAAADRTDLARVLIGVGVRRAAPSPDLTSTETFKAALLAAKSVSYVDPKAGGTSGTYFEGLIARLGIAAEVRAKTVYRNQGSEVAAAVADGAAEIGITFTSELAPNPGVKVAGVLPAAIQMPTIYTSALTPAPGDGASARAFMSVLQGPTGVAAFRKAGLEPLQ